MVRLISSTFKNFFYAIQESRENIFRSGGLVFIYCWLIKTKFLENISSKFEDEREKGKRKYSLAELIPFILLHILDGDRRPAKFTVSSRVLQPATAQANATLACFRFEYIRSES